MKWKLAIVAVLLLLSSLLAAGEPLKSSLQPGERLSALFEPLNVTGPYAGEPHCLVCENGPSPVAMVFARGVSEPLVHLLAGLDAASEQHKKQELGTFVVFLSDREGLEQELKQVAAKQGLKHTILSIDKPEGPEGFAVAKEAELTVVLYTNYVVKANHAFRKEDVTTKGIDQALADLPKIVPQKSEK